MFPVFFHFLAAVYWDYDPNEFDKLLETSYERPIFLIFYSTRCPHCHGIKEMTEKYAVSGDGKRNDVLISIINCDSFGHYCKKHKITSTPTMTLVMGTDKKYWPKVDKKDPVEWSKIIDKYTVNRFVRINRTDEIPKEGSVSFVLETPTTDTSEYKALGSLSKKCKVYGCDFFYIINKELSKPDLYALYSDNCTVRFNSKKESIESFVKSNKFGYLHNYDLKEYKNIKNSHVSLLFTHNDELLDVYKRFLTVINNMYCGKMVVGYSNDAKLGRKLGIKEKDFPAFVYKSKRCIAKTKIRLADVLRTDFFEKADNSSICDSGFYMGAGRGATSILCYYFSFVLFTTVIFIIIALRMRKTNLPKAE